MGNFSSKQKVAFWYVISLVGLVVLLIGFLLFTSERMVNNDVKKELAVATDRVLKDVRVYDNKLVLEKNITYYVDGKYVAVYKGNKSVSGVLPNKFPKDTKYVANDTREIKDGDNSFFVYDRLIENQQYGKVWVRGVTSANLKDSAPAMVFILKMFVLSLPALILFALIGAYYITKRTYVPILNELEESVEAERQFSSDVSHELRTPTAIIMNQCELELENPTDEKSREAFLIILKQARRMSDLISKLLSMARMERGIDKIKLEDVDLGSLVEECADNLAMKAYGKGIEIKCQIEPAVYTVCDKALIERSVENLISNSIKYGYKDSVIDVSLKTELDWCHITIKDKGIGIPKEDLNKIWERFYQVDTSRTHEDGSLGLGLAMVKWVVDAHKGKIKVSSEEGIGTTMEIFLKKSDF
ncbi:MAG: HAMP domain-containing sensor histidine kinase [Anaerovoracaceae bacterium]